MSRVNEERSVSEMLFPYRGMSTKWRGGHGYERVPFASSRDLLKLRTKRSYRSLNGQAYTPSTCQLDHSVARQEPGLLKQSPNLLFCLTLLPTEHL